ncbi:hypothetical protein [Arsenophonus apicola]|uniref:hypothetical protein n=1 Tax=Arsenophonus apicola TaxID=2879119 RepID=UPI001CDC3F51|nr:hypothetical protein [Arsenophonus apicola]UBX29535.1 hypothetical protein LDL57_02235 [Arsenophonus apicola]UBX29849.1 hypothetical protein LDL57_04155 [Arsenophonus apicola]
MTKQLALIMTLLLCAFGAGWKVNGLYHDSLELTAQKVADKTRLNLEEISSQSGQRLETKLEGIANAAPREIRTEIIKPVFTNICVSDEFVSMYNKTLDIIGRELSGKPAKKMLDRNPEVDRNNRL